MELSIIIPAFNVEKYIPTTLNSILPQVNENVEIIIVDDGSSDNTLAWARDILLSSKYNHHQLIHKENGGVSSARNLGILKAKGRYLLFLDGDDFVAGDLLVSIMKIMNDENADILCWGYDIVYENKSLKMHYFDKYARDLPIMSGIEALNNIVLNRSMWICTGNAAYRREYLIEQHLNYTVGCVAGEDIEFNYKALSKADKVVFIDKVLSYYVQRDMSVSNTYNIKRFDVIDALERIYKYFDDIGNKHLASISKVIINENMIEHYLGNYNSCIKSLIMKNISRKEILEKINTDLEHYYPNVKKKMILKMKKHHGNRNSLSIKIKAFLISPYLYYLLSKLYDQGMILYGHRHKETEYSGE